MSYEHLYWQRPWKVVFQVFHISRTAKSIFDKIPSERDIQLRRKRKEKFLIIHLESCKVKILLSGLLVNLD